MTDRPPVRETLESRRQFRVTINNHHDQDDSDICIIIRPRIPEKMESPHAVWEQRFCLIAVRSHSDYADDMRRGPFLQGSV